MSHSVKEKKTKPLVCRVVGDKMLKSRTAQIERTVKHATYEKYIKRVSKLMFHDEKNESRLGDLVLIEPSRSYSSRKRFRLAKIIEKARVGRIEE